MLKRIPKILRFIPGTAQDVRAYFLSMQYWLAGSEENIGHLCASLHRDMPMARARLSVPNFATTREVISGSWRLSPPPDGPDGRDAASLPAPPSPRKGTVGFF